MKIFLRISFSLYKFFYVAYIFTLQLFFIKVHILIKRDSDIKK